MPYKIEVTADSLSELAGKVLALAAQFQTTSTPEQPKADKPVKAPVAQEPEAQDPAPEEVEEAKVEEAKVEEAKAPTYDFNTEISPLVMRVAREKGRTVIGDLLAQFGVERASNVPAELHGELYDTLMDALAE